MSKGHFWLGFFVILAFAYLIRIIPLQNNNFFFTADQGYDAVHAREFFERGQLLLRGPETGIPGVFALPGWFYFISIGYWLFGGHPFGALFMVILLRLAVAALLMWQIAKKVSLKLALLIGLSLQFFWFFYDASRWAFNPFPLVILTIWLVILLTVFLESGRKRYFLFGLLPILLAFSTEIAGAGAFLLFYILFGFWAVARSRLSRKVYSLSIGLSLVVLMPVLVRMFSVFFQSQVFYQGSSDSLGVFSGVNFAGMFQKFLHIIQNSIVPQSLSISIILFVFVFGYFAKERSKNSFKKYFVFLSLSLFAVSYLWFSANKGWRDWHTIGLPTLLFTSFLLSLSALPKRITVFIFLIVFVSQFRVFSERYIQYAVPGDDPSILTNEIKAVDWIYQKAASEGFNVYTYMPSVTDYPYQYLFWWYGRRQYGYVPCEYANEPRALKYLYVPGSDFYSKPTLGCEGIEFLIIYPDTDQKRQQEWLSKFEKNAVVEEKNVGQIKLEMRRVSK